MRKHETFVCLRAHMRVRTHANLLLYVVSELTEQCYHLNRFHCGMVTPGTVLLNDAHVCKCLGALSCLCCMFVGMNTCSWRIHTCVRSAHADALCMCCMHIQIHRCVPARGRVPVNVNRKDTHAIISIIEIRTFNELPVFEQLSQLVVCMGCIGLCVCARK